MELVTINSILSLGKLARAAADKGLESALGRAFIAIGKLGEAAAAHSLEAGSKVAASTLLEIWKFSSESWDQEKVITFSLLFKEIGASAARSGVEEVVLSAVTGLGELGKKTAADSLELETVSTLLLLEEIGKLAAESYFDEALSSTALSIEEKLLNNSSVVAEMALDNFTDIGYNESEEKLEKFQEIKALQKKIQSNL